MSLRSARNRKSIPYTSGGVGVALFVNGQKRERWDKALIITDKDVREGRTIFY